MNAVAVGITSWHWYVVNREADCGEIKPVSRLRRDVTLAVRLPATAFIQRAASIKSRQLLARYCAPLNGVTVSSPQVSAILIVRVGR